MIDAHNDTVEVENPAEVLRDEDGVFQVTSPYGYVFQVICHRGSRMGIREIIEAKRVKIPGRDLWRIQRLNRNVA
jgi:hypothetical protein